MRKLFFLLLAAAVSTGAATCQTYTVLYVTDAGDACLASCNGACVDLTTDPNNCGRCGVVCRTNEVCEGADGGGCVPCPFVGAVVCGGSGGSFCTDPQTDNNNCGACGTRCVHGEQCAGGTCQCPLTSCPDGDGGSECVDLQTSTDHCGTCTTPCPIPPPQNNQVPLCADGQCDTVCMAPFADCDGQASNGCEANLQSSATSCGACGRSCGAGVCSSGMCPVQTYATGSSLAGLAIDTTNVYWANDATSGGIFRSPIGTSKPMLLYDTVSATAVGVTPSWLVWLQPGAVDSRLLSGGTVSQIASVQVGTAFAVASGHAYFGQADGTLLRVAVDGSAMATVLTTGTFAPTSLVVDGSNVYVADQSGAISTTSASVPQTTPNPFATSSFATNIAVDATNVYWTSQAGTVNVEAKSGGTVAIIASGQNAPFALATDGVHVYWSTGDGTVVRAGIDGTGALSVAVMQGMVTSLAVDGTNVYWTSPTVVASTVK